jgi:hypothetical protein
MYVCMYVMYVYIYIYNIYVQGKGGQGPVKATSLPPPLSTSQTAETPGLASAPVHGGGGGAAAAAVRVNSLQPSMLMSHQVGGGR